MSRFSEAILARYSASETETDEYGRQITVKRLRPWDESIVRKIAGVDLLSVQNVMYISACVTVIKDEDGKELKFAPPKNEDDMHAVMTALDQAGTLAAITAYNRLTRGEKKEGPQGEEAVVDAAKNSAETAG